MSGNHLGNQCSGRKTAAVTSNVDELRDGLQGDPVITWAPAYCEIYFQELDQVPIVEILEKNPLVFPARRGGRNRF